MSRIGGYVSTLFSSPSIWWAVNGEGCPVAQAALQNGDAHLSWSIAMGEQARLDHQVTPMVETDWIDTADCTHDCDGYRTALRQTRRTSCKLGLSTLCQAMEVHIVRHRRSWPRAMCQGPGQGALSNPMESR
jgi:hypothetical protein